MTEKQLIFIVGPTAIGKTSAAIKLAQYFNTEIISCDSRQIYNEMSIGTAKPTPEELASAKHHFIGIKSVADYYNASMYELEANVLIAELFTKYDKLIVVGGSGLYVDALLYGIDDLPTIESEIRDELQTKFENEGIESLRFMLKKLDPVTYEKVDLKNHKRILKSLEVTIQTGKPYSSFLTGNKKERNFVPKTFVLDMQREKLYERINKRVEMMIEDGLVEEVKNLIEYRDKTPLRTIGYKEIFDYMDGKTSLDEAVTLIQNSTRRYSRKQISWFKRNKQSEFVNIDNGFDLEKVISLL